MKIAMDRDGTTSADEGAARSGLDFAALAAAFQRRWALFAVVAGLVFAAVAGVAFLLPARWTASAQIKVEPNHHSATDFQAVAQGTPPDQALVDTEVNMMRSNAVARAVVETNNLVADPEFAGKSGEAGTPVERATTELLDHVDVERVAVTYLVSLSVQSRDPIKSAKLANALAAQYLSQSVESRIGTVTGESETLNKQLAQLGGEVQAAEARVAQYRSGAGIVQGGETGTITDQQVAPLSSQLATAEAEAAAAQARLSAARGQIGSGGIDSVSGVLNSQVIADLRRQRAEVLRKKGEVDARYGPKHPESLALSQQVADLDRQLREESARTVRGIESDASAASASAASLRRQLSALRGQQAGETRAAVMAESLERQADAKRTVYNQLAQAAQQRVQQRQNTEAASQIVQPAEAPLRPSFPNKPLFAVLGLLLGGLSGLGAILIAESLSVGLRNTGDAERWLGVPVFASIPKLSAGRLSAAGENIGPADYSVSAPASEYAEALRTIRHSLSADRTRNVVAICSSLPNEGKTTTAMALARVMSTSGDSTLIIDCDMRRGTLRDVGAIEAEVGLIEVLTGKATIDDAMVVDPQTGLMMMPVARRGFTPRDLFGGSAMADLIEKLRPRFDRIVLDTPPVLAIADARSLAALADQTLVLVRWNATSRYAARAAISRLRQDGTGVAGVVLTMTEKASGLSRSDPAYYSSAYSNYYRD